MTLRSRTLHAALTLLGLAAVGSLCQAQAQEQSQGQAQALTFVQAPMQVVRDPTLPPSMATAEPGAPAPSPWGGDGGMSVIARDGKAGLVVGTRVVYPGQRVGPWILERITETEVWLRDGAKLRKVSRFSGIQRRDPALAPTCPVPTVAQTAPRVRGGKTATTAPAASPASTQADPHCVAPLPRSSNP